MAERWPCCTRLGIHDRRYWVYTYCYSFGRDDIHVIGPFVVLDTGVADIAIGIPL